MTIDFIIWVMTVLSVFGVNADGVPAPDESPEGYAVTEELQVLAPTEAAAAGPTPEQFYQDNCWEDEVVVTVVHDPYGIAGSELACVPGDNMPWDADGNRP